MDYFLQLILTLFEVKQVEMKKKLLTEELENRKKLLEREKEMSERRARGEREERGGEIERGWRWGGSRPGMAWPSGTTTPRSDTMRRRTRSGPTGTWVGGCRTCSCC
jgi:hypothetical protein